MSCLEVNFRIVKFFQILKGDGTLFYNKKFCDLQIGRSLNILNLRKQWSKLVAKPYD